MARYLDTKDDLAFMLIYTGMVSEQSRTITTNDKFPSIGGAGVVSIPLPERGIYLIVSEGKNPVKVAY